MFVSYKWLEEYLDLAQTTPQELADKMSRTGIEVENVEIPAEGLKKIVVGDVKTCVPHPNSDHLSICQVDIGEAELSQIICGAPNIAAGKKVIVALPNSRITGNVKIKKGKMRGEVSNGMICSLQELGYSDSVVPKLYANGIYFLSEDAVPGSSVFPYLEMDDAIVELSITPNRADALSMRGVAHEVGAIYDQIPHFKNKQVTEVQADSSTNYLSVKIADSANVQSYHMRIVKEVQIKESPYWLQTRLMNAGIRPINNVVDITNYVLLEYGQPLHAFDYDQLGSKEIVVRQGKANETLVTLDEEKRVLNKENLVITNGKEPIALAGVMGGLDSEITDQTQTVVIESAVFDAISVRKTAKQFNLRSEASARFEKGINPATVIEALDFAAAMITELGNGKVLSGILSAASYQPEEVNVTINLKKINNSLGTRLTTEEVGKIFQRLGFTYTLEKEAFVVTIPPRRWDITIEADIIEEVARIYGYDYLPSTLPVGESLAGSLTKQQKLNRITKQLLEGTGLTEAISYVLTTQEKATQFAWSKEPTVSIQWPMNEERAVLRQNIISGLLDDIAYNVARKNPNVAFYETGKVFYQKNTEELPQEINHLGIALTGLKEEKDWQTSKQLVDFYTVKGIIEALFTVYGIKGAVSFKATAEWSNLHPGRTANIIFQGNVIGFVGQVHPATAKQYGIPETYVCELDLDQIFASERAGIQYQPVSKYPAVKRDIALLVDRTVTNAALFTTIQENGGNYLQDILLFDVYQGETVSNTKKSMGYTLIFSNNEATLVDEEVNQALAKVTSALIESHQVEIR